MVSGISSLIALHPILIPTDSACILLSTYSTTNLLPASRMLPQQFIAKWQRANLSERSAAQQHFLDLCDLLGQPKPAAADPDGAWYTFERGVSTSTTSSMRQSPLD
jgi:hypothetical protein